MTLITTLPPAWLDILSEDARAKLLQIENRLSAAHQHEPVYPPLSDRYRAFALPPEQISVCIVGQDPYHGPGQAMGLSFSVPKGIRVPPSLRNIYKELKSDYPEIFDELPVHGDLTSWANQGVLLLNTSLTVEAGRPGSHKHLGWDQVTSDIVYELSHRYINVPFVLWGRHAQELKKFIHRNSLVIESSHPSPIGGSCNKGFFGSRPFSRVNEHLIRMSTNTIDWRVD